MCTDSACVRKALKKQDATGGCTLIDFPESLFASDNPGFATDESVAEPGTHLMLPSQYERSRKKIEEILPAIKQ